MNLWHLFSTEELFKLDTFLSGGLWCADLGSIPGFGDDLEGTGPRGIFVSCWHATDGDPSEKAWEIFGGNGDGFAIGTTPEDLGMLATQANTTAISAQFGPVSYVPEGDVIRDPALEVHKHHAQEFEMRVVLKLKNESGDENAVKEEMRKAVSTHCDGRNYTRPIHAVTLSERFGSDFGVILPIDASRLFKKFLIGSKVAVRERVQVGQSLIEAGIHCTIRQLGTEP
jgi:hypothetical protein